MKSTAAVTSAIVCVFLSFAAVRVAETSDWLSWRGPNGNGVAAERQSPPVSWSESKNVLWKTPVPGRGHSSPTIVGDKVILTTAEAGPQDVQAVICFDRKSGKQLWKTAVNRGGFPARIHAKNSHATPTVASNGERLFAVFYNHGGIQLTALDLDGKQLWQKRAGSYVAKRYRYGYAPSPLLYKSLVIVSSESDSAGYLVAFDQRSGREVWRTKRTNSISYSSPVVAKIAGRDQLLISGGGLISSYNPADGKVIWSRKGICTVTCGTMVWDEKNVYVSGGYPQRGTIAVRADGSKQTVWTNRVKCYEQSMLAYRGHVYAVSDRGVAYCWDAATGTEKWSRRLAAGGYSASPVLANGNIYISNERGTTFVFKANPQKFELVARNQLGAESFATPTIVDSRIYVRVSHRSGGRRSEMLYCLGK